MIARTVSWGALVLLVMVAVAGWPQATAAHGKAVNITIGSVAQDEPLTRFFTARAAYSDGDPVQGASVVLTGEGPGGQKVGPARMEPSGRGEYSGAMTFPAGGQWRLRVALSGSGTGSATFVEDVPESPGERSAASAAASTPVPASGGTAPEQPVQRVKIKLTFGALDAFNVIAGATHVVAAVGWIGGMGFFLLVLRPMTRSLAGDPARSLAEGYRRFGSVAAVSLAVLLLTGVYNAIFNLPNSTLGLGGGLLSIETLRGQPYGDAYTVLLLGKLGLVGLMVGIAAGMRLLLLPRLEAALESASNPSSGFQQVAGQLGRLTAANLVLGVIVITVTVTMAYLHMISHAVRVLLPPG